MRAAHAHLRETAQTPGLDGSRQRYRARKHHVDMTAKQIVEGRRRTLVRHMGNIDAGGRLEEFSGQMQRIAITSRTEGQLSRSRLRQRHQLLH